MKFVGYVAKGYNQIVAGRRGRLLLVKKNGGDKVAVVELRPEDGGAFYSVVTAYISRGAKGEVLWDAAHSHPVDHGGQPAFADKPVAESVQATPNAEQKASSDTKTISTATGEVKAEATGGKIEDFGEKIGGARKDTASSGVRRARAVKESTTPAWKKRFKALQKLDGSGRWVVADVNDRFARPGETTFETQEEAEKAIPLYAAARLFSPRKEDGGAWELYKRVSDRKLLKMTVQGFASREAAMQYLASNAERLLDTKTSFGEEIFPIPDTVTREGVNRRGGDATQTMFEETFAPRGIEFGDWNNQEERQLVMNHAYDGLLDLADALNIPPKALMLNGELAIAFGSRGRGLTGAKAHYEADYSVINLTKMRGAGSLAHEWLHALDHYLARTDTKAKKVKVQNKRGDMVYAEQPTKYLFQSHGPSYKSEMREELKGAYEDLVRSLFKKAEQYVEDTRVADNFLAKARLHLKEKLDGMRKDLASDYAAQYAWRKIKKGLHPASAEQLAEFDRLASVLIEGGDLETEYRYNDNGGKKASRSSFSGRWTNGTLDAISAIYKAVRGRSGFSSSSAGGPIDNIVLALRGYNSRLKMFEDAKAGNEKTKNVPTNYAIEAKKMDQARSGDYWSEPHEMLARAFAAYVEDKIAGKGGKSDFLVYHAHGGILLPMIDGFVARPYPEGKEREAINAAFGKFISTLKTKETDKGTALYSRTSVLPWPADFPKAFSHTTVGKVTGHADHAAAKAGDFEAARRLAADTIKPARAEEIAKKFPDAIVVPVVEQEKSGINMIPVAVAEAYQAAGLRMDDQIFQVGQAKRSNLDAAQRLLARKEFSGEVVRGGKYILVDDILTQGGTIHEMYHHIVNNGGEVVGVVSLAFSAGSNIIAIQTATINKLAMRFGRGKLERILDEYNVAGTIEALTESEGNAILRFKSLDSLRNRLDEAKDALRQREDTGAQPLRSVREALATTPTHTIESGREAISAALESKKRGLSSLLNHPLMHVISDADIPEPIRRGAARFMVAWHGSPYNFDKFSTEKIGTGEGAQNSRRSSRPCG